MSVLTTLSVGFAPAAHISFSVGFAPAAHISVAHPTFRSCELPRVSASSRITSVSLSAPPEVQVTFACVMLLSVLHPLLPSPSKCATTQREISSKRIRASKIRLCAPQSEEGEYSSGSTRAYDAAEEKALRQARLDFGGYPAGKYYTIKSTEGAAAAYECVRTDLPALGSWTDDEIDVTIKSLRSTPFELLVYSPIGPFIVLSSLAIVRDGMDLGASGRLPPCREYLDFCANLPTIQISG